MSWIDKIEATLTITTGDGKQYFPLWMNANKSKEYNISEFDFANVTGTLVRRTTSKGRKYNIEMYFQGEDHLEISEAFEDSAENRNPWVISHPFYGEITVQPVGLNFDNSQYNVTKITGTIIETITEDNPKTRINPADNIIVEKENLDAATIAAFDETPAPNDIAAMQDTNNKLYNIGSKFLKLLSQTQEYFDKFKKAQSAINTAASAARQAMSAMQTMINAPGQFISGVKDKINMLKEQFGSLRDSLGKITGRSGKKIYEANATALISSMAVASLTPSVDGTSGYANATDVIDVADSLIDTYNTFLNDLDNLQSANGGAPGNYIPDANTMIAMNTVINNAISALFSQALNARIQLTLILEEDTDLVNLTHRLYGLDPLDKNIEELMNNNNIGLNEILEIRKGRTIVYYK